MGSTVTVRAGETDIYDTLGIRPEHRPNVGRIPQPYSHPNDHYAAAIPYLRQAQFLASLAYSQFERSGDISAPMARRIYEAMVALHKAAEGCERGEL